MTPNEAFEDVHECNLDHFSLPRLTPDPARSARVRAQCLARLVRQQERNLRKGGRTSFATGVLVPALAGGFCALYIAALVATTIQLYGVFL